MRSMSRANEEQAVRMRETSEKHVVSKRRANGETAQEKPAALAKKAGGARPPAL